MKIRSNESTNWSIEGITLVPGRIVEIADELRPKFDAFIKAGLITIVDSTERVNNVVKVESAPKKQENSVIQKTDLLNPTRKIYVEKQDNLNIIVEKGTDPEVNPVEISEKNEIKVESQDTEVITAGQNNEVTDTGFVILPGKKPGEGQIKSVDQFIQEKTDAVKQVLSDTAKELDALKQKEPEVKSVIPEHVKQILDMEANKRKVIIANIDDKAALLEIAECTADNNIKNIINQRLEEL